MRKGNYVYNDPSWSPLHLNEECQHQLHVGTAWHLRNSSWFGLEGSTALADAASMRVRGWVTPEVLLWKMRWNSCDARERTWLMKNELFGKMLDRFAAVVSSYEQFLETPAPEQEERLIIDNFTGNPCPYALAVSHLSSALRLLTISFTGMPHVSCEAVQYFELAESIVKDRLWKFKGAAETGLVELLSTRWPVLNLATRVAASLRKAPACTTERVQTK
eukprot:gnl/MRDRNA2_/MRDRNA2_389714_c0_seq1.p1 gnl/MRDRNA2_/MRDRNA2_389714_c0~~gnl/MRDRNA2_/MRDRNA2_389714_c0_seq1.p1  ORF type:complete len:219 (-),score=31.20 gnl/MRDRNA2_/MRDRNA2_389714_c0_seq1:101-757(-)